MILGIGNDLTNIDRIAENLTRHGVRFTGRIFTPAEIAYAESKPGTVRAGTYAKRYAAKEACAKALGTGFRDGLVLTNISVINDELGKPSLVLTGRAADKLKALTPPGQSAFIHLSLSDDASLAQAFVIIEAR